MKLTSASGAEQPHRSPPSPRPQRRIGYKYQSSSFQTRLSRIGYKRLKASLQIFNRTAARFVTHVSLRLPRYALGWFVAEIFIDLLQGDKTSYLAQDPDWQPSLPCIDSALSGDDFRMADLLRFAGVA